MGGSSCSFYHSWLWESGYEAYFQSLPSNIELRDVTYSLKRCTVCLVFSVVLALTNIGVVLLTCHLGELGTHFPRTAF